MRGGGVNIKKFIYSFLISFSLVILSCSTVFAGFGGGDRGGGFGSGGFGPSTSSTRVSYSTLCDICADVNALISQGKFNSIEPFKSHSGLSATIYENTSTTPHEFYIVVIYSNTTYFYTNNSGGRYFAYSDADDPQVGKPFYTLLSTISGYLNICATRLSSIVSYVDNIEGYIDGLEGYVDGIEGYIDGIEGLIGTSNSRLNTINSNLNTVNNNLTDIKSLLDYDHICCGFLTDNNNDPFPTVTITYNSAEQIISFLNSNWSHKPFTILNRDGNGSYIYYFVRASFYSTGGKRYINVALSTSSTSTDTIYGYWLCDTTNTIFIVSDPTYSDSFTSILTKLNNISVNTSNSSTTAIIAPITGIAGAVADINADITVLSDLIDTGFDDVTDAITSLAPVTGTDLVPYIDQLEGYTDGIENSLNTTNNKLDTIISYLNSNDLIQEPVIISLVDNWGQDLVYSIVNAAPVLHLFYYTFDGNILPRFDQSENGIYTLWEKEYDVR